MEFLGFNEGIPRQQVFRVLCLIFLSAFVAHVYSTCLTDNYGTIEKSVKRLTTPRSTLRTLGFEGCLRECLALTSCLAVNFNTKMYNCEILYDVNGILETDDDFWYTNIMQWKTVLNGPCIHHTCPNLTRCVELSSGTQHCIRTDCGSPPSVANATGTNCSSAISSNCTYQCNSRFLMVGGATVVCQASGTWTSPNFHCTDDCLYPGVHYIGKHNTTINGRTCQIWTSNTPHDSNYATMSTAQGNYCRDYDNPVPWCYTTDPAVRWENCSVPSCVL